MTRQEAIKRLLDEKERLIKRLHACEEPEESAPLFRKIARKEREIEILQTMFCDKEDES